MKNIRQFVFVLALVLSIEIASLPEAVAFSKPSLADRTCAKSVLNNSRAKSINSGKSLPSNKEKRKIENCLYERFHEALDFYSKTLFCNSSGDFAFDYVYSKSLNSCIVGDVLFKFNAPNWKTYTHSYLKNGFKKYNLENWLNFFSAPGNAELKRIFESAISVGWSQGGFIMEIGDSNWAANSTQSQKRFLISSFLDPGAFLVSE